MGMQRLQTLLITTLVLALSACTGGPTPAVPGGTTPPPSPPDSPPAPPSAAEVITLANAGLVAVPNGINNWSVVAPINGKVTIDTRGSGPVGYLVVCDVERNGVRSIAISATRFSRTTFETLKTTFAGQTFDCNGATPKPPTLPPAVSWDTSVTGLVGDQRATVYYGFDYGASTFLLTSAKPFVLAAIPQGSSGTATALYYNTIDLVTPVAIERKLFDGTTGGGLSFNRATATALSNVGVVVNPPQVAGTNRRWGEYVLQAVPPISNGPFSIPSFFSEFGFFSVSGFFLEFGTGSTLPSRIPTIPTALLRPKEVHTLVVSETVPQNAAGEIKVRSATSVFNGERNLQLTLPDCETTLNIASGLLSGSVQTAATGPYTNLTIIGRQLKPTQTVAYKVSLESTSSFDPGVWTALPGWKSDWRFATGAVSGSVYLSKASRVDGASVVYNPSDGDTSVRCGVEQAVR